MLFSLINIVQIIILVELTIVLILLIMLYMRTSKSYTSSILKRSIKLVTSKITRSKKKYANTGITINLAADYKNKILTIMKDEKLFLNPDLKLNDMALKIGLSKHQTSQIVNEQFNKDFNTFINEFRIEEAILLLRNDPNLTINDVLYDVGFNNSTTFYNAFKRFKHIPPSEYLNKQLSGNNVKNYNS